MRYDEVLTTFAAFFERECIDYAVTGDLALHVYGHPRTRARFDFIVDSAARERTNELVEGCGFDEFRRTINVSVYQRASQKVAIIFGTVRPSIPGLYFGEKFIPLVDPTRRLPLTSDDIEALEYATMEVDLVWLNFTGELQPPCRNNAYSDEPFRL